MENDDDLRLDAVWNQSGSSPKKKFEESVGKVQNSISRVLKQNSELPVHESSNFNQQQNKHFRLQHGNRNHDLSSNDGKNYEQRRGRNATHLHRQENIKSRYTENGKKNDRHFKKEGYDSKVNSNTKPLSFMTLQNLTQKVPNEILLTVGNKSNGFMLVLDQKDLSTDKMAYVLIILGKSCLSDLRKNVATMVTIVSNKSEFLLQSIQKYLVSLRLGNIRSHHIESLSCLATFLYKFQLMQPSSASEKISILLPLLKATCLKLLGDNEVHDEIITKLTEIDDQNEYFLKNHTAAEIKKASYKEQLQLLEPPENYRSIPVLPNSDDIHSPPAFLRPNIVEGKYVDTEHYLDVQYRLLREDYVKPLRDGIAEYLRLKKAKKSYKNCKDVRIYEGVHIVKQDFVNGGMVHIADFSNEAFSKMRWEYSKRFLSGSLLCLSSDDFKTMLFASVARRIPEELRKGLLLIRFEEITDEILNLSPLRSFVVIETSAYFEAYRYNLKALHELNEEVLPFKKYIVNTEKAVDHPKYLNESTTFDMRPLFIPLDEKFFRHELTKDGLSTLQYEFPPDISNAAQSINILNDEHWPTKKDLNLDNSQYLALKAALTREFAVIQGPPGTGKTYIGLRIVQLLLHNMDKWWMKTTNSLPILVVCYTNHALDQFLEGLMLFTNKIVRIGGRGNNEAVSQFQISNLRKNAITKKEIPKHISSSIWQKNHDLRCLKSEIDEINKSVEKSFFAVLGEFELQPYMPSVQYDSLRSIKYDPVFREMNLKDDGLLIHDWLGIRSRIGGGFEDAFEEFSKENTVKDMESIANTFEINDEDVEGVGEGDIEFIEAQRDIDFEDFAGVSFNIETPEKRKDPIFNYCNNSEWKVQGGKKKMQKLIKKYLRLSTAFEESVANRIRNIWNLNIQGRWQLYKFWLEKYIDGKQKECLHLQLQLKEQFQEVCEIRTEEDVFILQNAYIVGMTTTGAAKYRDIVVRLNPQLLIVEEAAEILESHTVTSLAPRTQHVILIGDHQQLRPSPTVHMLSVNYDLDISLFERMIKNNMDCFRLSIQHRMRPDIADLIVPHIYKNLENHESVSEYEDIKGISKNIFFVTHNFTELQESDSKSRVNEHEAKFLIQLCKYLIRQGYDSSKITVLTTYSGQLFVLKKLVTDVVRNVRFTVVDNFQGEENDIILISFVRSNDEGEIGFLKISNRVCVALSRAKKGLYCIGNFELLADKSELWSNIVKTLQQKQCIGPSLQLMCQNHPGVCTVVSDENDFQSVPEGGCTRVCEYRLSCGHSCAMMCHPYDAAHEFVKCQKPCPKTCEYGHPCQKKCSQNCGKCTSPVKKAMLFCVHTIEIQCCMQNEEVKCYMTCGKRLSCGHACTNKCSEDCTILCNEKITVHSPVCGHDVLIECCYKNDLKTLIQKCNQPCRVTLECGHTCKGTCKKCHQSRLHVACGEPCKRILVCGHECKSPCSKSCPPCKQPCENRCSHSICPNKCGEPCSECTEQCQWSCKHQKCFRPCGKPCNRFPCSSPCPEVLPCGHPCIGFCGEPCPKVCRECDEEIVKEIFFGTEEDEDARYVSLEDCGHIFEISGLDQWMKSDDDKGSNLIQMKSCPKCKTVIRTNLRFGNKVKNCLKNIEKVKLITFGKVQQNEKIQLDLCNAVNEVYASDLTKNAKFLMIFRTWKKILSSKKCRSIQEITTMQNMFRIFLDLIDATTSKYKESEIEQPVSVKQEINSLLNFIRETETCLVAFIEDEYLQASEQQLQQLMSEVHRLKLCNTFIKFTRKHRIPERNLDFQNMVSVLMKYAPFKDSDMELCNTLFQNLTRACGGAIINLSDMEKKSILKAMNLSTGHWYQCPNGHVYCITECGGAMQEGTCPDCKERIGGSSHRLLSSNRVATEMDGAINSAWSEGMNLGNYEGF